MCGIVGYIGNRQAQSILLNCLKKLEYRGYDSCGIAIAGDGLHLYKDSVRVEVLGQSSPEFTGTAGIGHTRWATHGAPSQVNAHPHLDCTGDIAVVHNGVINNFQELKDRLISEGHTFISETDTEIISHLIEKYYNENLETAVEKALNDIEGSYAIIVLITGESKIVVARKDSPLIIGIGDKEYFVASDIPALLDYTDRVIYLDDGDIGIITVDGVEINKDGNGAVREENKILWTVEEAQKGGYEHFMIKEIHEQPRVIRNTLGEYSRVIPSIVELEKIRDSGVGSVLMVASGTSYHAALVGKFIIEDLLNVPVRVEIASEFNYYSHVIPGTVAIAITQSGETADTLKAMRRLREAGCQIVGITNVLGCSASRIANKTIYIHAGPEISVAATKSFTAQLIAMYWLAMSYSGTDTSRINRLNLELKQLPSKVQQVLDDEDKINENAGYLSKFEDIFYIGKGISYPVALEGAWKLTEVSYIHATGYAAGELKHCPFALLGSELPVIAVVARDSTYEAMLTNIKQVKARGSHVTALVEEGDEVVEKLVDSVITLPSVDVLFTPVINTVVLQLLAYYIARKRKCPIDFPRNLAKSVTVE